MKLSVAHAILAATAATTSARLFAKNEARQLQLLTDDVVCPMNWDPVCGADGETYSNNCYAEAAGATVASEGECPPPPLPTLPAGCTTEYDPVCAADGAESETFANSCLAEACGWTVVSEGKCPVQPTPPLIAYVVGCNNEIFEPVCGANGQTYSNTCGADTEGVSVVSEGKCPSPTVQPTLPVPCPLDIAEVCGADGVTYDNECLAEAAGTTVSSKGVCPEIPTMPTATTTTASACPMNYEPVCGADGVTYDNECLAEAAGTTVASKGVCPEIPTMPTATTTVDAEVNTSDMNTDMESTTSSSPTVTVPEATTSGGSADTTNVPGDADPALGALSDPDTPSSASTADVGTATVLAVSAVIFVAV